LQKRVGKQKNLELQRNMQNVDLVFQAIEQLQSVSEEEKNPK
jgi:hypothetical protein